MFSSNVKGFFILAFCIVLSQASDENNGDGNSLRDRIGKVVPIFQVVRFPNDVCVGSSNKNGTCYTSEECEEKGGSEAGSCAEGFGICCIFNLGCGSSTTENCTYFEVQNSAIQSGQCRAEICKAETDICQIRLDFNTFVITGPNTLTDSYAFHLNGEVINVAAGKKIAQTGRCLTDTFTVSNQNTLPVICGTMTGQHVYFEADDDCNSLDFKLGAQMVGVTSFASRSWSIKVTQLSCTSNILAPSGCDQYYYGSNLGTFQSFNYGTGSNRHLAEQHQTICFRREANMCRICYSADAAIDVSYGSFKALMAMAEVGGTKCCAYGADGMKTTSGGYDCIMIPGAITKNGVVAPDSQCANRVGLVTKQDGPSATVCSRLAPFRFDFFTDSFELAEAAIHEAAADDAATPAVPVQIGFKARYYLTGCTA